MSVVEIKREPNSDAIQMLTDAIERVKSGEIKSIGLSWVTKDGSIGGDISQGDSNLLMWSALNHSEREFYYNQVVGK